MEATLDKYGHTDRKEKKSGPFSFEISTFLQPEHITGRFPPSRHPVHIH